MQWLSDLRKGAVNLYNKADEAVGGILPYGSDSPSVGASRSLENRTPTYTPRREAVDRARARTKAPSTSEQAASITYGGGGGGGRVTQADNRTPLERAPVGQRMKKGGVWGHKAANGQWVEGDYVPQGGLGSQNPLMSAITYPTRVISEAGDRGLIPIPTVHSAVEGPVKFLKSYAGDWGRPFRVEESLFGRDEKFQDEINRGTHTGNTISYGTQDKGYKNPSGLKEQLERGIYGQWTGTVNPTTGAVTLTEGTGEGQQAYDTNQDTAYFQNKFNEAKKSRDIGGMIEAKFYGSYAARQEAGQTNQAPMGTQPQVIGYVQPTESSTGVQTEMAPPSATQPIKATAPSDPATNGAYTVQQGDTLTDIARKEGTSVQELMRKNSIRNANIIKIGQQLKY